MFYSFLKFLDFFPETIQFNLDSKGPRKTVSGGIISIILICSSVFLSIIMLFKFLTMRKPNIIIQTIFDPNSQISTIQINYIQLLFSVWINGWDKGNYLKQVPFILNNSIIWENYVYRDNNKEIKLNQSYPGDFLICNQTDENITHNLSMNSAFTICTNFTNDFKIGGSLKDNKSNLNIELFFDTCSFIEKECHEKDADDYITYSFAFNDKYFDYLNEKKYSNFLQTIDFQIKRGMTKFIKLKMIHNKLIINDDLFYDKNQTDSFNSFEILSFESIPYDQNLSRIKMQIEMPLIYNQYTLSYPKFDSYLSSIFAIINVLCIVSRYLLYVIRYDNVKFYLMSKLYYFHKPNDNQMLKNLIFKDFMNKEDENSGFSIDNRDNLNYFHKNENKMKEKKDIIKNIETFLKGNNLKKERMRWFEYYLCCKKEDNMAPSVRQFLNGKKMLDYDLNIVVLLKKMIEFESILSILFDEKQLQIIKGIHPRLINDSINFKLVTQKLRFYENEITEETAENFIRAFYHCSKSETEFSKRIYNNLDFHI